MPVTFKTKMPLERAQALAEELREALRAAGCRRVEVCGSVRRMKPEVGDLDLVIDGDLEAVRELHGRKWTWKEGGESKATIDFKGVQVNLLRSDPEHWGAATFYFTGPFDYNIAYRKRAKQLGLLLNEKGLFLNEEGPNKGQCIASRTEEEIYNKLGRHFKPPELRGK